jgi:NADPH:quinone reductase-like Zn-dependent oxidoreductase
MRAFVMQGFGASDLALPGTLAKPRCRPGDLLVRVAAAGVNPTDWKEMEGNLVNFYPPYEPRWAPGFDGAGIVEEVGEGVAGFKPGDRVVLMSDRRGGQSGTFAEYVRVSEKLAAKAPASISLTEAASIPIAGLTAYQALVRDDMGRAKPGQSLMIHGAAGGLGSFATCFARAIGMRIAATCRPANDGYLRQIGAEHTIDYTQSRIAEALKHSAPQGVDVVIDAVSGGKQAELLDALAPGGRLVIVATITDDGDIPALGAEAERRGCSVHFLILDHLRVAQDLRAIARLIDGGTMRMPQITRYPLGRAGEALRAMQAGGTRGKLVIEIADLETEQLPPR